MEPGRPLSINVKSNAIEITWTKPNRDVDYYHIQYKEKSTTKAKWKLYETEDSYNRTWITGLQPMVTYVFRVKSLHDDDESQFGPVSDEIRTVQSLASRLLDHRYSSIHDVDSTPKVYKLNTVENLEARNKKAKTKMVTIGDCSEDCFEEKTLMLIGATGSGKSTMVDGIINYISGVNFEDDFRFTVVELETEERKQNNQAVSQTEWITVYRIAPQEGGQLSYKLNIIDTPGFGDTKGLERDEEIVDQIRNLFSATGEKGVQNIDAVCFIVKASDFRLTAVQRYIFFAILSIFGKDIEQNICTMITFSDGKKPLVLASLKEANVPFGNWFSFNNSGLFEDNMPCHGSLSPMFWKMGFESFKTFFKHLDSLPSKSLSQTKEVLQQRKDLQELVRNIQPQIRHAVARLNAMKQQLKILIENKAEIERNKNFKYTVQEERHRKIPLIPGTHVTNCILCNVTCHAMCTRANNADKQYCCVMDKSGNCRVCPKNCNWQEHQNDRYKLEYYKVPVEKTYNDIKQKFESAEKKQLSYKDIVNKQAEEIQNFFLTTKEKMTKMNQYKNTLRKIALRPDPLSNVQHIEIMIKAEKQDAREGWEERIAMYEKFKEYAKTEDTFEEFRIDMNSTTSLLSDIAKSNEMCFQGIREFLNKLLNLKL